MPIYVPLQGPSFKNTSHDAAHVGHNMHQSVQHFIVCHIGITTVARRSH